jgi:hypothetical protein
MFRGGLIYVHAFGFWLWVVGLQSCYVSDHVVNKFAVKATF